MEEAALTLVTAARRLAGMVLDPSERIFWGFLVTSALMAWAFGRRLLRANAGATIRRFQVGLYAFINHAFH